MTVIFKFKLFIGLAVFSQLANAACLGDQTSLKIFTVYIVPQLTATQIYSRWSPVLEKIGKETKQCFDLLVPQSIPQFEADLASGKPDFAFMNPYHIAMKWGDNKYSPLVASSEPFFGVLVVKRDSKINSLKDLSGSKIAFPAPNAFAASLLIRQKLSMDGVSFEPVYTRTHGNVYRSVVREDVMAGGGIHSTLTAEPPELQSALRVLVETKQYSAHPFSANARIPQMVQKSIQSALIKLGQSSEGAELLQRVQLTKPMTVTYTANYQPLEALQLEKYVVKSGD